MIIAIPFDTIFAGEVEQAAAGAEITSLEIEDLAADVASDEASSLETEDLGEETAEDLGAEPSEDLGERNESKWMDSDGNIKWPPNGGFDGEPKKQVLAIGTIIDRYGDDFGSFVSPEGTPYEYRSLAPGTKDLLYSKFEIKKPITVQSGWVAAWFNEPGGGVQYKLNRSVDELLQDGFLERKKQ